MRTYGPFSHAAYFLAALLAAGAVALPTWSMTDSRLSDQIVTLARRCVDVGLPPEYPVKLAPSTGEGVAQEYNAGATKYYSRGFFEYSLYKSWSPSLYADLKRFWKRNSYRDIAAVLPDLAAAYGRETDTRVRWIHAALINELYHEAYGDVLVQEALASPMLTCLSLESDGDLAHYLNEVAKSYFLRHPDAAPPQARSLLATMPHSCEAAADRVALLDYIACGARGENRSYIEIVLAAGQGQPCEQVQIRVVESANCLGEREPEQYEKLLLSWYRAGLSAGGGPVVRLILKYWAFVKPDPTRMPLLIQALEAEDPATRQDAVNYLAKLGKAEASSLPYDTFLASTHIQDDALTPKAKADPGWYRDEFEACKREHEKALTYWKEWWKIHKSDSLPKGAE